MFYDLFLTEKILSDTCILGCHWLNFVNGGELTTGMTAEVDHCFARGVPYSDCFSYSWNF